MKESEQQHYKSSVTKLIFDVHKSRILVVIDWEDGKYARNNASAKPAQKGDLVRAPEACGERPDRDQQEPGRQHFTL